MPVARSAGICVGVVQAGTDWPTKMSALRFGGGSAGASPQPGVAASRQSAAILENGCLRRSAETPLRDRVEMIPSRSAGIFAGVVWYGTGWPTRMSALQFGGGSAQERRPTDASAGRRWQDVCTKGFGRNRVPGLPSKAERTD